MRQEAKHETNQEVRKLFSSLKRIQFLASTNKKNVVLFFIFLFSQKGKNKQKTF